MDDIAKRRQEDWERSLATWKSKQNKDSPMYKPVSHQSKINHYPTGPHEDKTFLTKFLIFLAFAIPVALLGYALYINYLPFGYEKTYTLTIDESGVISPLSNEIYLTTPQGKKLLSLPNGVEGQVNLVIEPNVVLKDATVEVTIEGEGVYLATPPNITSIDWDYNWDFTQGVPEDWQGTAQYNSEEVCTHFNAYNENTLSLPNSQNLFENGPMRIYVKWKPSSVSQLIGNNQQIVGHYNWEIWQSEKNVQFRVGRMNDANGTSYSINYPVTSEFFNVQHEALAIYSPSEEGNGYIEFWIDNNLVGRVRIGSDIIYQDYSTNDLSLGWSPHNNEENSHFDGCIYNVKIGNSALIQNSTGTEIQGVNGQVVVPIIGNGRLTTIRAITLK